MYCHYPAPAFMYCRYQLDYPLQFRIFVWTKVHVLRSMYRDVIRVISKRYSFLGEDLSLLSAWSSCWTSSCGHLCDTHLYFVTDQSARVASCLIRSTLTVRWCTALYGRPSSVFCNCVTNHTQYTSGYLRSVKHPLFWLSAPNLNRAVSHALQQLRRCDA